MKSGKRPRMKQDSDGARVSVSFTAEQYTALQIQAEHKRVSVAWVVRDAVDQYLAGQAPLFAKIIQTVNGD